MIAYSAWKDLLRGRRLPAMLVDLEAFDRNARKLGQLARDRGKNLRVATKSIRVPELIGRLLAQGHPWRGLMCFSVEEAAVLANAGHSDLLIAYPTVQATDVALLRELHETGKKPCLVVDSREQLARLAEGLRGVREPFPLILEIDLALRIAGAHLGVRRSPLRSVEGLGRLAQIVRAEFAPTLRVGGCMGYEAQVAGLGDRNPFKRWLNPAAWLVRRFSRTMIARRRAQIPAALAAAGVASPIFNGGGSGSLDYATAEGALTEVTAGSGFFGPHLFDYYSNISFEPAAFFALQAVRASDPGYVTCLGGGYIASGEPGWDRVPRPWLPEGAALISSEGAGEVQTPLRLARATDVAIGDPVLFRHAKAGELAERFNECLLVQGGKIVGTAKTYRGLGHCFF